MLEPARAATAFAPAPEPGLADLTSTLQLRVAEMRQLFNAMDPAPFRERDLDPNAVSYIVDWAREAPTGEPLRVAVELGRGPPTHDDVTMLREAMHEYFRRRALATRRQLRQLFRVGRVSLVIGIAFLAGAIAVGEAIAELVSKGSYSYLLKESFVIGGWVALWRPLEIFLYDWWPIHADAKLYDRLSVMDVSVSGADALARSTP